MGFSLSKGWAAFVAFFRRMARAEERVQSSLDSKLTTPNRTTTDADWARVQKAADERRKSDDKEARRRLKEERDAEIERLTREFEEQERARRENDWKQDTGGDVVDSDDWQVGGRDATSQGDAASRWIVSGNFKTISDSSNVYAIAYNVERGSLFVQYKHWDPSLPLGEQHGAGPIYEYKNVSIVEALALYKTADVGGWLWDHVRVRGTWSQHKKPYRLVAISREYLPRKAAYRDGAEWFLRRQVWRNGKASYSQLPDAPAPPIDMNGNRLDKGFNPKPWRGFNSRPTRPDSGKPDRGK